MITLSLFDILLVGACVTSVSTQLLNEPITVASQNLPVPSSFRSGNGFVTTNTDVIATSYEGNLHIIRINDFLKNDTSNTRTFRPSKSDSTVETFCSCNPTLFQSNQTSFVIYAVSDRDTTTGDVTSRILAVNLMDASLTWHLTLPGLVIGSPQLNSNKQKIYVVHNIFDTVNEEYDGRVTVISFDHETGQSLVVATLPDESIGAPFGPPTLKTVSQQLDTNTDNALDATDNLRDVIFFGESRQNGFSSTGSLYALIEMMTTSSPTYNIVLASTFPGSGITFPAVSSTLELYLGTQSSTIIGYTAGRSFGPLVQSVDNLTESTTTLIESQDLVVYPRWIIPLSKNASDESAPIPVNPLLSPDEQSLYVVAAGNQIYCVGTGGDIAQQSWTYQTDSSYVATPVYQELANSANVIYFIEKENGQIRQFDAESGTLNWATTLGNNVEADFVLGDGGLLYCGDTRGRIVALKIADVKTSAPFPSPTWETTTMPSSGLPTKTPTIDPTASSTISPSLRGNTSHPTDERPVGSSNKTHRPIANDTMQTSVASNGNIAAVENEPASGKNDKLPLYLGVACGGMALLSVFAFLLFRRGGSTKQHLSKEKEQILNVEKSAQTDLAIKGTKNQFEQKEDQTRVVNVSSLSNEPPTEEITTTTQPAFASSSQPPEETRNDFKIPTPCEHDQTKSSAGSPRPSRRISKETLFHITHLGDVADQLTSLSPSSSYEATNLSVPVATFDTLESDITVSSHPREDNIEALAPELAEASIQPNGTSRHSRASIFSILSSRDDDEMDGFSNFMDDFSTDHVPPPPSIMEMSLQEKHKTLGLKKQPVKLLPARCESPTPSDLMSVDESLYLDEGAISEADIGAGRVVVKTLVEAPNNEYADDPPTVLKPGSHYIERHSQKKIDGLHAPIVNQTSSSLRSDRARPIYNGVSVRPTRSKAGIFSRRLPNISIAEEETSSTIQDVSQEINSVDNISSPPHVNPAPASYYVEENEVTQRNKHEHQSAWNILLNDLLVAENLFFNPVSPSKSPDGAESQAVRPRRSGHGASRKTTHQASRISNNYDSDNSSEHGAPPPPRTFMA